MRPSYILLTVFIVLVAVHLGQALDGLADVDSNINASVANSKKEMTDIKDVRNSNLGVQSEKNNEVRDRSDDTNVDQSRQGVDNFGGANENA